MLAWRIGTAWLLSAALCLAEWHHTHQATADVARVACSAPETVSLMQTSLPTAVRRQVAGDTENASVMPVAALKISLASEHLKAVADFAGNSENASGMPVTALEIGLARERSNALADSRQVVLATGGSSLSSAAVDKTTVNAPPEDADAQHLGSQRSLMSEATIVGTLLVLLLLIIVLAILWYVGAALGTRLCCFGRHDNALPAVVALVAAGSAAAGVVGYMCWRWHTMRALAAVALAVAVAYAWMHRHADNAPSEASASGQESLQASAATRRGVARTHRSSSPWLLAICAGGCLPGNAAGQAKRDKGRDSGAPSETNRL